MSWILSNKTYISLFAGGFAATYLLVPMVRVLALRLGAFDPPSERRMRQPNVPTLGGLAVAAPLYVGVALLYLWPNVISERFFAGAQDDVMALLGAGFLILLLGVYDDLRGANASLKFSVQIVASLVICVVSGPVRSVTLPLAGNIELGLAAVPVTVFWIVAVTNAFNLIDGLDGLAAGVGALVYGVSFVIAHRYGHVYLMVLAAIMAGSLPAFLRYNFPPARIFLGDTGSLFIGFIIAVVSLQSSMKGPTTVLMLIPVCVLGYPLLDVSLAVLRRLVKGKPIFSSDRSHIHHKLLAAGLGHRGTIAVAYGITLLFVAVAIFHIYGRDRETGVLLIITLAALAVMFRAFGYLRFARDHFNLAVRRKYRLYNLVAKITCLKMEDARSVEELWELLCYLGKEFNLCTVALQTGEKELNWRNPSAVEAPGRNARRFELNDTGGVLRVSHNGQKDEDIELEQSILLEKLSDNLAKHLRRLTQP